MELAFISWQFKLLPWRWKWWRNIIIRLHFIPRVYNQVHTWKPPCRILMSPSFVEKYLHPFPLSIQVEQNSTFCAEIKFWQSFVPATDCCFLVPTMENVNAIKVFCRTRSLQSKCFHQFFSSSNYISFDHLSQFL